MAQVTGVAQNALRQMPPGTNPALHRQLQRLDRAGAATGAVVQDAVRTSNFRIWRRTGFGPAWCRCRARPFRPPMAANSAHVQVDLDPRAMQAHQVSATDVQNAIAGQTQIIPAGNIKIGSYQYVIQLNDAAQSVESLNDMPIKATADGATVFMRDVAHVRDGSAPQTSIVHVDGGRAVLSTILKNGSASTLDVVQGIKDAAAIAQAAPAEFTQDRLAQRSVDLRESGDLGRGARRCAGGAADQPDDPSVPGKLAFHPDHRHLDPAFGPGGADRRFGPRVRASIS